MTNKIRPKF